MPIRLIAGAFLVMICTTAASSQTNLSPDTLGKGYSHDFPSKRVTAVSNAQERDRADHAPRGSVNRPLVIAPKEQLTATISTDDFMKALVARLDQTALLDNFRNKIPARNNLKAGLSSGANQSSPYCVSATNAQVTVIGNCTGYVPQVTMTINYSDGSTKLYTYASPSQVKGVCAHNYLACDVNSPLIVEQERTPQLTISSVSVSNGTLSFVIGGTQPQIVPTASCSCSTDGTNQSNGFEGFNAQQITVSLPFGDKCP